MTYLDIIKTSPGGGENGMWEGVKRVSEFLEKMREEHPHEVKEFLKKEYEAMNGHHFNLATARKLVSEMHHTDTDKDKEVVGELINVEDAQELVEGMPEQETRRWDAYVAANTMAHDLANTGMNTSQIMNAARHFFFHDEDFSDENKVFWYYEWMLFN